jgi:type IX secretion system PorP/SprF family membrane protein
MKINIKYNIVLLCALSSLFLEAQIEPMYGMYRFNVNTINPAQAGATKQKDISLLSRWQWTAIDGAPKTHLLSFSMPYKQNVGFGLNLVSDNIGPVSDFYIGADYAYSIALTNKTSIAAGIRLSVINHQVNLAGRDIVDQTDEAFKYNLSSGFRVNPGFGFLLSNPNYYMGISLPRLLRFSYGDVFNISTYKDVQHAFLYGGFQKKINTDIELRPSAMLNFSVDAPLSLDINFMASYQKYFDLGIMYRMADAVGIITGYKFSNGLYAGYSYEYPVSQIRRVSRMTHELALRFTLQDLSQKRILTPRYFN